MREMRLRLEGLGNLMILGCESCVVGTMWYSRRSNYVEVLLVFNFVPMNVSLARVSSKGIETKECSQSCSFLATSTAQSTEGTSETAVSSGSTTGTESTKSSMRTKETAVGSETANTTGAQTTSTQSTSTTEGTMATVESSSESSWTALAHEVGELRLSHRAHATMGEHISEL